MYHYRVLYGLSTSLGYGYSHPPTVHSAPPCSAAPASLGCTSAVRRSPEERKLIVTDVVPSFSSVATEFWVVYIYLESPKTFFFCVFVFGLIFLRFCSKNAFLEMRTQKKVQSESSSGRVRHGRLKTPFGRKKTRFGRRKKVSGHCLRRI